MRCFAGFIKFRLFRYFPAKVFKHIGTFRMRGGNFRLKYRCKLSYIVYQCKKCTNLYPLVPLGDFRVSAETTV